MWVHIEVHKTGTKMRRKRKYIENGRRYTGCWFYTSADGHDKTYFATYLQGSGKKTAKFGKYSEGKTLAACSHFRSDLMRGRILPPQEIRLRKQKELSRHIQPLFELYIAGREKTKQDISRYETFVYPFWVGKDITEATNTDAAKFRTWLEKHKKKDGTRLSPQTVKHCIGLFRRIVRYAKKNLSGFELKIDEFHIPMVRNEVTEDLSKEQLQKLIHVLKTDKVNRAVCDMLMIILNTGMRRSEILKLQWQHINFERKTILLKDPKGKEDVKIPMNQVVAKILDNQKKKSMYVFPGNNGQKRAHVHKQARRLLRLAGISDSFRPCHGLRHFYGTELAAEGHDIKTISELMGHKSIEMTNRYLKARDVNMISASEHMARITGG